MSGAERNITCVISGSFDHKGMIDEYRRTFERWGVRVLQPPAGQPKAGKLYIPTGEEVRCYGDSQKPFWPPAEEVGKSIGQVEHEFLEAIGRASLLYLMTVDRRIGLSAAMEVGWALGAGTPIYTNELPCLDSRPSTEATLAEQAQVMSVSEAIEDIGNQLDLELWIPGKCS